MAKAPDLAMRTRFASVDVLRGWAVAAMLLVNYPGSWEHVYAPLQHARWNGFTPTDLIFPAFLFVVGVSIALGLRPGTPPAKIGLRALRLVLLGLALHAVAMWAYDTPAFRPWGVLQRIGICYAAAALVALRLDGRGQWAIIIGLLLGYWVLLAPGGYEPLVNLASRIDAWMLGPHAYRFDADSGLGHDPEGLASTLPAVAGTLIGVRAGVWLRERGLRFLILMGLAMLALGGAWSLLIPLNKYLWTSSFVVFASGWSLLLLALCHALFDLRGWRPLGRSMGINAITAYAGSWLMACLMQRLGLFDAIWSRGFEPLLAPLFGAQAASLSLALAFVAFWSLAMWAMARRGWKLGV